MLGPQGFSDSVTMAPTAMGANRRPPDTGGGFRPPDDSAELPPRPNGRTSTSSSLPRGAGTPAWAGASSATGESHGGRSYAQIIAESTSSSSPILLQIQLSKIYDRDHPETKPMNLSEQNISDLIFSSLKIPAEFCIELDTQTGRYERK